MQHRLFQVELPIHPGWEAIEPLRGAVLACVAVVFPRAGAAGLGVVVAELLENALKFGAWQQVGGYFALRVDGQAGRAEVEVANPVLPGDPHVERLSMELARIARAPSPQEAYVKAMRGLALGKQVGIGLSRAAHEGGCDLSAEVRGGVVRVRAVTRQLAPPAPTPAAP